MTTTTRAQTQTVSGVDVRKVAEDMWQEIVAVYDVYGRYFPYDKQELRRDLGLIMLWDMAEKIRVQFYDNDKVLRLSYEFLPLADPGAVHSPVGEFPRYEISPEWRVRVVAVETARKPANEVAEFYQQLGWRTSEALTITGTGTTEPYGSFRSGGFVVSREVYNDIKATENTTKQEVER
jgi:hypothetical protein